MAKTKNTYTVTTRSESCKGCGLCIEYCKSGKLAFSKKLNKMGYFYAEPVQDKECTGCMSCTLVCPDLVIEVYDG
ncbi:MAG: 4Fe-4S dicluster domain-containing protein [Spirochaetes bacterium]|nr:4Fe-4S dicluster domain-containing protein [Spirochaetota bacterium]